MKLLLSLCLLGLLAGALPAEVVEYTDGQALVVPCQVNPATTTTWLRMVVFMGTQKLSIKGTWRPEDLDVVVNGNGLRIALRANAEIPVGVIGDNGVYYHLVVKPAAKDAQLDPTIRVIRKSESPAARYLGDPAQTAGGHWEHETNLVIRLQKHVRGGRQIPSAQGGPRYNADILKAEGRRVAGERWTENDDWRVYAYYTWKLGGVSAHLIGVTYTGREKSVDFNYLAQRTERSIAIWHMQQPGEPTVLNRKYPGIFLQRGREEWFVMYTVDKEDR